MTESQYKIIILGDVKTGKSSFVNRITKTPFKASSAYLVSGIHQGSYLTGDRKTELNLCAIHGADRFSVMASMHAKQADLALLFFDLVNRDSFGHLDRWYGTLQRANPECPIILVANKSDQVLGRFLSEGESEKKAGELDAMAFVEISTRTGNNIGSLIDHVISAVSSRPRIMAPE